MTLQQMLADAQLKLHQLLTGRLSVEVMVDGYTVRYTRASIADLRAYIAELQNQILGVLPGGALGIIF